jgi:hypothetical protein
MIPTKQIFTSCGSVLSLRQYGDGFDPQISSSDEQEQAILPHPAEQWQLVVYSPGIDTPAVMRRKRVGGKGQ